MRRTCRLRLHNLLRWNNKAFTSVHLLRTLMKAHGWTEQAPWHWTNGRGNNRLVTSPSNEQAHLQLLCPQVRQQWRRNCLDAWASGPIHEAARWRQSSTEAQRQVEINGVDLAWVRGAIHTCTASERAVLLGSAVSPCWLHRSHCVLGAPAIGPRWSICFGSVRVGRTVRPMTPSSFLQQRFGWPPASQPSNIAHQILHHMGEVIARLWNQRHNLEV